MSPDIKAAIGEQVKQSTGSAVVSAKNETAATRPIHLLAYVHLRNIYASTGAGRVARQLTEHLALREDIDLRILADQADQSRILPLVGEPWKSYRYHTFSADTSKQQALWLALNNPKAENYWPEADIVFCTGESYVPVRKARLVVTAHDAAYFEPSAHRRGKAFWLQRLKWKVLFSRLSARADLIHTVSQFSADRLAYFFPALASRIRVVPNAVTPHFFMPAPEEGLRFVREQELASRPFILIPGGLHYRKNADLILDAAPRLLKRYPDLVIAVVNHCDPVYAARAAALGPRFRVLGFVSEAALHALYATAAVVWFPSRYEGFGLPVLEAMASGAPVVASDASSLPEIAGDAALLASAENVADHVGKLSTLLEQPALCERLSRLGRARSAKFTWANSAAQLKRCFDEIL